MQEKLFVSYARQDRKYLAKALGGLEREGVLNEPPVLIHDPVNDTGIPGAGLRGVLRDAIGSASTFVLLWTKDASESHYVNYEAGMADALGKPIIVVFPEGEGIAPELPASLRNARIVRLRGDA